MFFGCLKACIFSPQRGVIFACLVVDMFIFHHTCCGVVFAVMFCLSEQVEILCFAGVVTRGSFGLYF